MDADLDTSVHKSHSQGAPDDGKDIIQETEAYKVGRLRIFLVSLSIFTRHPL